MFLPVEKLYSGARATTVVDCRKILHLVWRTAEFLLQCRRIQEAMMMMVRVVCVQRSFAASVRPLYKNFIPCVSRVVSSTCKRSSEPAGHPRPKNFGLHRPTKEHSSAVCLQHTKLSWKNKDKDTAIIIYPSRCLDDNRSSNNQLILIVTT